MLQRRRLPGGPIPMVAPGVNVISSILHQFCDTPPCFAFLNGTSVGSVGGPEVAHAAVFISMK